MIARGSLKLRIDRVERQIRLALSRSMELVLVSPGDSIIDVESRVESVRSSGRNPIVIEFIHPGSPS